VRIDELQARGFRNLVEDAWSFVPGLTLILGPNGAGKSNLLEALCVFTNLASFRTSSTVGLFAHGAQAFSLTGRVTRGGSETDLRVEALFTRPIQRTLFRGGRRLSAPEYLRMAPSLALSSHDRLLILGNPDIRRRFLDRLAFELQSDAMSTMQRYRRILRQRAVLLRQGRDGAEMDAFEHDLAREGARLVHLRLAALRAVLRVLPSELAAVGWSLPEPMLRYHDPAALGDDDIASLAVRLQAALAKARRLDRIVGSTSVGPHRHDLVMTMRGIPLRDTLSAGQVKLLATALKLAVLRVLTEVRGEPPMVVFDDVDAELDAGVLAVVLGRLAQGQAVVSSAHHAMMGPHLDAAVVWHLAAGRVERDGLGGRKR